MPVAINHRYETQGTYQASLEVLTAGSGSFTSNQVQITVNTAVGDFDADHDVDLADFAHVQACLDGPGVAQNDPACQDAQLDADDDVDNNDLRIVVGCLSGADIPVNTKCAP